MKTDVIWEDDCLMVSLETLLNGVEVTANLKATPNTWIHDFNQTTKTNMTRHYKIESNLNIVKSS